MVQSRELAARFEAYSDWRRRLSAAISTLHEWLAEQDLADAQTDLKVQQQAYYNRGNSRFQAGDALEDAEKKKAAWEDSLKDFESAMKLNNQDNDSKNNHEFVKKKLEELKQQQQQQNQQRGGRGRGSGACESKG